MRCECQRVCWHQQKGVLGGPTGTKSHGRLKAQFGQGDNRADSGGCNHRLAEDHSEWERSGGVHIGGQRRNDGGLRCRAEAHGDRGSERPPPVTQGRHSKPHRIRDGGGQRDYRLKRERSGVGRPGKATGRRRIKLKRGGGAGPVHRGGETERERRAGAHLNGTIGRVGSDKHGGNDPRRKRTKGANGDSEG